ncbi:hypothetical protein Patl1_22373 [Pistacia atlantica]|uniref:Uncharacterized protein n=1 Tax=Pistacia atlantica TaxID=434234 RepID=A0ACC0ZVW9_9ROSI|nr:hypothetical protein Patl1_22373 [Pistacia atlantica]
MERRSCCIRSSLSSSYSTPKMQRTPVPEKEEDVNCEGGGYHQERSCSGCYVLLYLLWWQLRRLRSGSGLKFSRSGKTLVASQSKQKDEEEWKHQRRERKKEKKKEKEVEEETEIDPDIAAMMGFGSFHASKK